MKKLVEWIHQCCITFSEVLSAFLHGFQCYYLKVYYLFVHMVAFISSTDPKFPHASNTQKAFLSWQSMQVFKYMFIFLF